MNPRALVVVSLAAFLAPVAAADLVAFYPFNGNANDTSGSGAHGTVFGAALVNDRFGAPNSAYHFDGVDDFIKASADLLPSGDRTIAFWFYCETDATYPVMLSYGGSVCGDSWFCGLNANTVPFYHSLYVTTHCNGSNMFATYGPGGNAPINAWRHFAFARGDGLAKIYMDGVAILQGGNVFNTFVAGRDLAIGVDVSPGGFAPYTDTAVGYFQGMIDDVRIYDTGLTPEQIAALANYSCIGDVDGSGIVDGADLTELLGEWGGGGGGLADLNQDGIVNGADITVLLGGWGPCGG